MPYLNVKVSAKESEELEQTIISILMNNTSEILGKKKDLTSISIEYIKTNEWFIAGKKVAEHQKNTFYLNVKVTKGTNTKKQKALYIKETFSQMQQLLGDLLPASYIVIDEVEADSWGFEGKTQENRFINSHDL